MGFQVLLENPLDSTLVNRDFMLVACWYKEIRRQRSPFNIPILSAAAGVSEAYFGHMAPAVDDFMTNTQGVENPESTKLQSICLAGFKRTAFLVKVCQGVGKAITGEQQCQEEPSGGSPVNIKRAPDQYSFTRSR